jgi:hypothetical protein
MSKFLNLCYYSVTQTIKKDPVCFSPTESSENFEYPGRESNPHDIAITGF